MAALDEFGLRQKQRKFCDLYLVCGNATQAAIAAGYKAKNAKYTASEILTYPNVIAYLNLKRNEHAKRVGATFEAKLKHLWNLANYCMGDETGKDKQFNPMGVITAIAELNKMQGHYVKIAKVITHICANNHCPYSTGTKLKRVNDV